MFRSVEAIVLQLIPHKDHSAIVKFLTRDLGLSSCWINSLHGKSSGIRSASLQPLTIVNAIITRRDMRQLATLKEMHISFFPSNINNTIEKSAVAIFITELLTHIIKESETDEALFDFLKESILLLDNTAERCANFHLVFMLHLSNYLGLLPNNSFSAQTPYLDLEEGTYKAHTPMHTAFLYPDESEHISKLSAVDMTSFATIAISPALRKNLLHGLLKYFEIHTGMTPLKSHLVLEEVF